MKPYLSIVLLTIAKKNSIYIPQLFQTPWLVMPSILKSISWALELNRGFCACLWIHIFLLIFVLYIWMFARVYVCAPYVCLVLMEAVGSCVVAVYRLWAGCRYWELNPGPLQEQQVLLTTKHSFRLHFFFFLNIYLIHVFICFCHGSWSMCGGQMTKSNVDLHLFL